MLRSLRRLHRPTHFPTHSLTRRTVSTLKPNVLKNDPFLPIYAGFTTLATLAVLTVYKNYNLTTKTEKEVQSVRQELLDALHQDYTTCIENNKVKEVIAPTLINLCWNATATYSRHDHRGGVGGATMRFPPESEFTANKGLKRARDFIEPFKKAHPSLSYADLWTLAAVVAIEALGGPVVPWVSGRPDAEECDPEVTEARCPVADSGSIEDDIDHIKVLFGRIGGLKYKHIVALFGAHSVGSCHEVKSCKPPKDTVL
jgi:catalase (peroxidase I)